MKAILLLDSFGKRIQPITNNTPKCLVKINGKPLLDIWLDNLINFGIGPILINTHYFSEKVFKHIKNCMYSDHIKINYESELLGSATTLYQNRNFFYGEDVLLINTNNLCIFDYNKFLNAHINSPDRCVLTMMTFFSSKPCNCNLNCKYICAIAVYSNNSLQPIYVYVQAKSFF